MPAPTPDLASSDDAFEKTTYDESIYEEITDPETAYDDTSIGFDDWLEQPYPTNIAPYQGSSPGISNIFPLANYGPKVNSTHPEYLHQHKHDRAGSYIRSAESSSSRFSAASVPASVFSASSAPSDTTSLTTDFPKAWPPTEQSFEVLTGRKNACDSCGSRFSRRKDLIRHKNTHNQQPTKAEGHGRPSLGKDSGVGNHSNEDHSENSCSGISINKEAAKPESSIRTSFEFGYNYPELSQRTYTAPVSNRASSFSAEKYDDREKELCKATETGRDAEPRTAGLSPSQESPQSDSESSSSSTPGLLTRDERKSFILDRLMSYFFQLFASCHSPVPMIETAAGSSGVVFAGTGGNNASSGNEADGTSESSNIPEGGARAVRKRNCEEDGDDGDKDRPCKSTRIEGNKRAAGRKLACPYFKKDPEYSPLARSCSGPGWDTVHRINCDRCYTAFKTDADRTAHLRSETQYIPSPYYNYASFQDPGHPTDLMVEYDRYLRREMPDRIRHQLGILIEGALNPVEETLRAQIPEIVREIQNALFESFRTSIGITRRNSHSDPGPVDTGGNTQVDDDGSTGNRSSTPRDASVLPNSLYSEQPRAENIPEAYPPGPVPDNIWRDFDWELFDLSSLQDLPETHAFAHDMLPMSREEVENDSLLPRETSFV
ncbi:hypothetical protein E8E14_013622 [Neopestalotiopsis sp. 37M]|nr:hypothetical protein E8E14_013622 [Neopestalotiopsis sp. 37M]